MGDIMLKKIFSIIKKFIIAVLIIYAYNKMAFPLNLFIPINIFTITLVMMCGIPSIVMLVLFSLVCI